jgi:hypothetical protein
MLCVRVEEPGAAFAPENFRGVEIFENFKDVVRYASEVSFS